MRQTTAVRSVYSALHALSRGTQRSHRFAPARLSLARLPPARLHPPRSCSEGTPVMRVGFFGGSFDPPHAAHRLAAEQALEAFALECVLLAPAGHQPLKAGGAEAPFADRLRMVELLCNGNPRLHASAIDAPRPDGTPNYTVDTLRRLRAALDSGSRPGSTSPPGDASLTDFPRLPTLADTTLANPAGGDTNTGSIALSPTAPSPSTPAEIFAIVGADAFLGLRQWRDSAELLRLARWIVISRPGFVLDTAPLHLTPAQRSAVHLLPGLHYSLSATRIRECLHLGGDCHHLVPPAVLRYLQEHDLYRD